MRELKAPEIDRHCKDITTLGYTTLESLYPKDLVTGLRSEIAAIHAAGKFTSLPGGPNVPCVQNLGIHYIDLITAGSLEKILMRNLNDPYYREIPQDQPNYILSEYLARTSSEKLPLHIDSFIPTPGPRTYMMQMGIALDDRGEADGCTVVVPGTHQSGQYTDRSCTHVTPVPLKAGDAVLWDSRLWHGTTEAKSTRSCWVLVATFQMWFIKPRFDATRSLPKEIYSRLSLKQKAVMGFCSVPPSNPGDQSYRKGYEELSA